VSITTRITSGRSSFEEHPERTTNPIVARLADLIGGWERARFEAPHPLSFRVWMGGTAEVEVRFRFTFKGKRVESLGWERVKKQ
jgi:hypothetical protein